MSEKQKASLGCIVIYHGPSHKFVHDEENRVFQCVYDATRASIWKASNNGADVCPAIITRAWNEGYINVSVIPDNGVPMPKTSVILLAEGAEPSTNDLVNGYCTWPERV